MRWLLSPVSWTFWGLFVAVVITFVLCQGARQGDLGDLFEKWMAAGAPGEDATLSKGLVAWWKLDEAGGRQAADSSGHRYHGTLVGEPKWQPKGGGAGGALELSGNGQYVVIAEQKAFDLNERMTVAAWIYVTKFDKKWQTIVAKGDTSWRMARDKDRDCVQFAFNAIPKEQLIKGTIPVNDGKWHHVAGVYDGKKMYLYVDGKLDGSTATTTNIPTSTEPVCIGENSQAKGRFWNGLIEDVRIYDRALTTEEIATLADRSRR